MALSTIEAFLMPHGSLSQLLFGSENSSAATRTTLASWSLDRSCIVRYEWTIACNFILAEKTENFIRLEKISVYFDISFHLPHSVGLQEAGTTGKAIPMWSPFLAVASLAIDILIGSIASDNRVQSLGTISTFEAFLMPHSSLGQLLFGSKNGSATTRAALTWWGSDYGRINSGGFWGMSFTGNFFKSLNFGWEIF